MGNYTFCDIDNSNIRALDKYIKTVIVNTKKRFTIKENIVSNNELFLEDMVNDSGLVNSMTNNYNGSCLEYDNILFAIENFEFLMQLSKNERDIIYKLLEGYKIIEIAQMKGLSEKTIRKYRNLAFEKLKFYLSKN